MGVHFTHHRKQRIHNSSVSTDEARDLEPPKKLFIYPSNVANSLD